MKLICVKCKTEFKKDKKVKLCDPCNAKYQTYMGYQLYKIRVCLRGTSEAFIPSYETHLRREEEYDNNPWKELYNADIRL
jgi:hypothetical protein